MNSRMICRAAMAAAVLVAFGCSDNSPASSLATGPTSTLAPGSRVNDRDDGNWATRVYGVQRVSPLGSAITVSADIGPGGGDLEIPTAGLHLHVPMGAVSRVTTFSVTALSGRMAAYDFEPHGNVFPVALTFTQDVSALRLRPGVDFAQVGYFAHDDDLSSWSNSATVRELLSIDYNAVAGTISTKIRHFSGYLVAAGRDW
ncbi:MAG TPA: hypothetical protein VN706_18665 [Gemmatimonadaceae bacterium]|nr:hypothetical protein [Gemmatimonadaceae bacterium]